jgi:hypothetical protein
VTLIRGAEKYDDTSKCDQYYIIVFSITFLMFFACVVSIPSKKNHNIVITNDRLRLDVL